MASINVKFSEGRIEGRQGRQGRRSRGGRNKIGNPEEFLQDSKERTSKELVRLIGASTTEKRVGFENQIADPTIEELMNDGYLRYSDEFTDENCLAHGGQWGFTPGGEWETVTLLDGKDHEDGGIKLTVEGKRIEAQGGELVIKNSYKDVAIIPKDYVVEILDMIEGGCFRCLDNLVKELPTYSDN
jgi:hypothetical protein